MVADAAALWHAGRYGEADAIYRSAWPRAEVMGDLTGMVNIALGRNCASISTDVRQPNGPGAARSFWLDFRPFHPDSGHSS